MVSGFGSRGAELKTAVEGYQMTPQGLRKLGLGTVEASPGKGPGAVVPAAVAIASGHPIGLIVSSAVKVQGQLSGRTTIEGRGATRNLRPENLDGGGYLLPRVTCVNSAPQYFFHRPQQINIRVLFFGELRDTRLPCSKHRLRFGEPVLNNGVYLTLHALYKKGGNTWDKFTKQAQVHTCLLHRTGATNNSHDQHETRSGEREL
jgi:hypothetical protein